MGIFDRFPYSSTHEMNLDFMLGKATEIAESLQEIDTHKEQAEQAATNAAQSAQSAAQAAQAAAGSQTAAGTSASQAAQHKADAEDAADRAEAASDLADEAVEQAQTAAQNASTAADGAIESATAAETRINNLAASLPTDFTELNNEITDLKSAIKPKIVLVDVSSYYDVIPKSMLEITLIVDESVKNHTFYISNYGVTDGKFYFNIFDVTANTAILNYNENISALPNDIIYLNLENEKAKLNARINISILNKYWNSYTTAKHIELIPEYYADISIIPRLQETYPNIINGTSILSDLDNITQNIAYRLNFAINATSIPAHTPYGSIWKSECIASVQSYVKTPGSHSVGDLQIFIGSDGTYLRHFQTTTFTRWFKADQNAGITITVDVNGGGDYTSLCEAIIYALTLKDTTVYVKQGIYDAIAEMKAIYGNNYFDNLTSDASNMIYLQNGIKIICEPGTEMVCEYTGSNENVNIYFTPLNFHRGEASIEGLTIKAKNTRYCIHDDQWDSTIPYRHILKNCTLIIDNSENTNWDRRLAYGGGLGIHGYIEFDGCFFKSVGLNGETAYSGWGTCGFHNSPAANAQSRIVVKNCYFADGSTFRLTYFGDSTKITTAFVSGCSLGRAMELEPESASATVNNCEIIDCANTIRST